MPLCIDAILAAIRRSAEEPGPESARKSAPRSAYGHLPRIVLGLGGASKSCLCAQKQHPQKVPGQSQENSVCVFYFGTVQKVFSEKASAIARMRQKCVRNASKMRQKCVKVGLVLLGKEDRSKMRQKCVKIASKMRQKCAEHLWGRTPFGRYRLLFVCLVLSNPKGPAVVKILPDRSHNDLLSRRPLRGHHLPLRGPNWGLFLS